MRAIARERRAADLAENKLIAALCPGFIDTDASRPWFADMSHAQTPAQAASWPLELVLGSTVDRAFYGELVQFGQGAPVGDRDPSTAHGRPPVPTAREDQCSRLSQTDGGRTCAMRVLRRDYGDSAPPTPRGREVSPHDPG